MIPASVICRCGASVSLSGGSFDCTGSVRYSFCWAGGVCPGCGLLIQFARDGKPGDYKHARWWCLGKEFEDRSGMPRAWPAEWGFSQEQ